MTGVISGQPVRPVKETGAMIAEMAPLLDQDAWVFCSTSDANLAKKAMAHALSNFIETEGTSFILPMTAAQELGFPIEAPMARITLTVHSALDGVGLTAAVAGALAEAGIPCNMVAAFHHDHVFVPQADAGRAMEVLRDLSRGAMA